MCQATSLRHFVCLCCSSYIQKMLPIFLIKKHIGKRFFIMYFCRFPCSEWRLCRFLFRLLPYSHSSTIHSAQGIPYHRLDSYCVVFIRQISRLHLTVHPFIFLIIKAIQPHSVIQRAKRNLWAELATIRFMHRSASHVAVDADGFLIQCAERHELYGHRILTQMLIVIGYLISEQVIQGITCPSLCRNNLTTSPKQQRKIRSYHKNNFISTILFLNRQKNYIDSLKDKKQIRHLPSRLSKHYFAT